MSDAAPAPVTAAAVEKAAVQFTQEQFATMLAALQPKPGVIASVGAGVSSVEAGLSAAETTAVADVKAALGKVNWPQVVTFGMAAAALALHFVKLVL